VDPGSGDTAAGVLVRGDRVMAADTGLGGGAGRAGLGAERRVADGTQADRAGIGYRETGPAGAEMIKVGLGYPLADWHPASARTHVICPLFRFSRH
jgi:hypothetical protein